MEELRGTVIEIRPKALYRVRLVDGRVITVNVDRTLRHAIVRILEGQGVLIRLSENDPHRGQIIGLAR